MGYAFQIFLHRICVLSLIISRTQLPKTCLVSQITSFHRGAMRVSVSALRHLGSNDGIIALHRLDQFI